MSNHPLTASRPYTVVVVSTLALIVLLGLGGTVIYLTGLPLTSPVPLVFTPVAIALIVWASRTGRWGRLGFTRTAGRKDQRGVGIKSGGTLAGAARAERIRAGRLRTEWLPVLLPMIVVLLLVVGTTGGAASHTATAWLGLVGLVALVAFVEETVFRSWFLGILAPKGRLTAVLVSTAAFALAHAVNALGGQDLASTVGQIVFAVAFGLFAACAYLRTGSIWPAMAFHALFDLAQLSSQSQTPAVVDVLMTVILLAAAGWLWVGIRAADRAGARPADGPAPNVATTGLSPAGVSVSAPVGATGTAGRGGALG